MSDILYRDENGLAWISFNRPRANAYDLAFHEAFAEAIDRANADPEVRVVIIQSAVEKFFCAGADIHVFAKSDRDTNRRMVERARANLAAIESSGKLFIATINGHCLGGGLEIALACDIRFGAEGSYTLGLPEVKLGLIPGNGGTQRLARVVGASAALDLCVSGRSFDPSEAFRLGLFSRLLSWAEFERVPHVYATELANSAPLALAALKRAIRAGIEMPLAEGLELEAKLVDELYGTEDAAEGFRAFMEKRAPEYRGR